MRSHGLFWQHQIVGSDQLASQHREQSGDGRSRHRLAMISLTTGDGEGRLSHPQTADASL